MMWLTDVNLGHICNEEAPVQPRCPDLCLRPMDETHVGIIFVLSVRVQWYISPLRYALICHDMCMHSMDETHVGHPLWLIFASKPSDTAGLLWCVPALNGWDTCWSSSIALSFQLHLIHLSSGEKLLYRAHATVIFSQNLSNPKDLCCPQSAFRW